MKSSIDFDSIRARNPPLEYCRKRGIELRENGTSGRLVGLCPPHQEKTPSFHVYLDDDHYYCFGCRVHGDVIDLEQAFGGGTVAEAAQRLGAQRTHLPKMSQREPTSAITEENPFGLPYRISDDECRVALEAAARLVTTENAIVEGQVRNGNLRARRITLRAVRFLPSDVAAWLQKVSTMEDDV